MSDAGNVIDISLRKKLKKRGETYACFLIFTMVTFLNASRSGLIMTKMRPGKQKLNKRRISAPEKQNIST